MKQVFWRLVHRYLATLATAVLKRIPTTSRYSWEGSLFIQLRQYWHKQTADAAHYTGFSLPSPDFSFLISFPSFKNSVEKAQQQKPKT